MGLKPLETMLSIDTTVLRNAMLPTSFVSPSLLVFFFPGHLVMMRLLSMLLMLLLASHFLPSIMFAHF